MNLTVTDLGIHLLRVIQARNVPFRLEQSCQIRRGHVNSDRFLVSTAKKHLGDREESILRDLGFPREGQDFLDRHRRNARYVHFGFEGRDRPFFKVYFEGAKTDFRAKEPIFSALKWDPGQPNALVLTEYHAVAADSFPALVCAVGRILSSAPSEFQHLLWDVLRPFASVSRTSDLRLLEVVEPGSPRRSFDLNLYPLGLNVHELGGVFRKLAAFLAMEQPLAEWLQRVGITQLGHLAMGQHRDGEPFFTIYFGMKAFHTLAEAS